MGEQRVAAVYTRGLNAPYTEGYVAAARSVVRAIASFGWTPLVLNFEYSTRDGVPQNDRDLGHNFEVRIPGIQRDILFHEHGEHGTTIGSTTAFASVLESMLFPALLTHELRTKTAIVHLVNCFMLPRALLRLVRKTPVLAHVYQNPAILPLSSFPLPIDAFVASSRSIAATLRAHHSRNQPIHTIPPAVDPRFFEAMGHSHLRRKLGLYVGNLSRKRFPNEMFEVIKQIVRQDSAIAFRLIAPVNRLNIQRAREIIAICRALAISDRVTVSLRNMDDNQKLAEYSAARFFLFPPICQFGEAIEPPLTLLEALACGLPVLATDTYSASDAVISGKNGFLVNLSDYSELAEHAVAMLQAHPDQWCIWSAQARKIAFQNFSLQSVAKKLAILHSAILNNPPEISNSLRNHNQYCSTDQTKFETAVATVSGTIRLEEGQPLL